MTESAQPQASNTQPSVQIRAQYLKDLSFESPHAPASLFAGTQRPNIDVGVDLKAQKLQDGVYEVLVMLTARASNEGNSLFLIELAYAGVFQLDNVPEEHTERVLLIDGPFMLFPFMRRIVSDVTRDGGFPPLMLDPIDFHRLYLQNKAPATASA